MKPLRIKGDCVSENLSDSELERLESVSGDLNLHYETRSLPNLKTVVGTVYCHHSQNVDCPALKTIGGWLLAMDSDNFSAPVLESVEGIDASMTSRLSLPSLQTVRGDVLAEKSDGLNVSALVHVGGEIKCFEANNMRIPDAIAKKNDTPDSVRFITHAEKAIAEFQNNSESLNQGIK